MKPIMSERDKKRAVRSLLRLYATLRAVDVSLLHGRQPSCDAFRAKIPCQEDELEGIDFLAHTSETADLDAEPPGCRG